MKLNRRVFVVGGAHTPFIGKHHPDFIWKKHPDFGTRENPNIEEYIQSAVDGALEATGVPANAIQKGYVGNFLGGLFSNQAHLGAMLAGANASFAGKPFSRVEAACASGGIAVLGCIDSIQAGYDVTLALGAEVQTTVSARQGGDYLARASHYATERELDDFTFPCLFARRAKHFTESTETTMEDIGRVSVKAYNNANKNPLAHMRARQLSLEVAGSTNDKNPNFLRNEDYKEYLRMTDCSQVSDGASAIVLASEEGLKKLGIDPSSCTEILSYGHSTSGLAKVEDFTELTNIATAAKTAYEEAGLNADQMQVAEVHDCFAVTEIMMYEALGFAEKGKGYELVRNGDTEIDGRIPVNTGGGLIGFGHPVGATGIKQILEIWRQMKGQCGDYQVSGDLTYGITANMGGDDRTSVVMIHKNL